MRLPDAIVEVAEQQLGAFARWQFPSDMPQHRVDDVLRHAGVDRLHRGVYGVDGSGHQRHRAAIAAALRAGPGATLSGAAALELGGPPGLVLSGGFLVLMPAGRRLTGARIPVLRDPDPDRSVVSVGAVRVATPVDALVDCLREPEGFEPRRLRLSHDLLRWEGLLRPGDLAARARVLGLTGAQMEHDLFDLDGQRSTGRGERMLARLFARFDPAPEADVWVTPSRRVDHYFRPARLGVEYQGSVDHDGRGNRGTDAARAAELARDGIRLLFVTASDLHDERTVVATVAGALAARALELGVAAPILRAAAVDARRELLGPGPGTLP